MLAYKSTSKAKIHFLKILSKATQFKIAEVASQSLRCHFILLKNVLTSWGGIGQ